MSALRAGWAPATVSKQDAGAQFAITQLFFDARDYESLVSRARAHGCTMPILPGLMPVTNAAQIERFAAFDHSGAAGDGEVEEEG